MIVRFQIPNQMKKIFSMISEGQTESARSVDRIIVTYQISKASKLVSNTSRN